MRRCALKPCPGHAPSHGAGPGTPPFPPLHALTDTLSPRAPRATGAPTGVVQHQVGPELAQGARQRLADGRQVLCVPGAVGKAHVQAGRRAHRVGGQGTGSSQQATCQWGKGGATTCKPLPRPPKTPHLLVSLRAGKFDWQCTDSVKMPGLPAHMDAVPSP